MTIFLFICGEHAPNIVAKKTTATKPETDLLIIPPFLQNFLQIYKNSNKKRYKSKLISNRRLLPEKAKQHFGLF
ncbi:MAG TPA: hypothetical protein DIT25_02055 [Candidatus Moranbacteria bacterium]|nr:hypothetical protein [Candidatus Moranbacteria bacterium]